MDPCLPIPQQRCIECGNELPEDDGPCPHCGLEKQEWGPTIVSDPRESRLVEGYDRSNVDYLNIIASMRPMPRRAK
jgi:RNA polymerase subunit RPABC4/transcription elongation factor Spt4